MGKVVDVDKVAEAISYCSASDLVELAAAVRKEMGAEGFEIFLSAMQNPGLRDRDSGDAYRGPLLRGQYAVKLNMNSEKKILMIKAVRILEAQTLKEAKAVFDEWFEKYTRDPANWACVLFAHSFDRDQVEQKLDGLRTECRGVEAELVKG